MRPLAAVVAALFPLAVYCRRTYNAQLKFEIDAACVGVDNYDQCRQLCQPGKCCFVNQDCNIDCEDYESCGPVFEGDEVPDYGSTGLDPTSYDAAAIEVACADMDPPPPPGHPTLCEMLCQPGKCCFDHVDCDASTHDAMEHCLKYEACWVLYENSGTADDDAVANEKREEEEEENTRQVRRLEGGTEEYYDTDDHYDPTDYQDDDEGQVYAMMDPSTYTAEDIQVACEEMQQQAGSLCHLMCEPGRCCFEHTDCDVKTHDDADQCLKYTACWILHTDGTVDDDVVPVEAEMPESPEEENGNRRRLGLW